MFVSLFTIVRDLDQAKSNLSMHVLAPDYTKNFRPLPFKIPWTDSCQMNIKSLPGHDDPIFNFGCLLNY
jgi:hypothetical protein